MLDKNSDRWERRRMKRCWTRRHSRKRCLAGSIFERSDENLEPAFCPEKEGYEVRARLTSWRRFDETEPLDELNITLSMHISNGTESLKMKSACNHDPRTQEYSLLLAV